MERLLNIWSLGKDCLSQPAGICWLIAVCVFAAGLIVMCIFRKFHRSVLPPLIVSVYLSACCLYFPMVEVLSGNMGFLNPFLKVILTAYYGMKLFMIDGNFTEVRVWLENTAKVDDWFANLYESAFLVLCVIAAIAVTSAILSIFKNVMAYVRLYIFYNIKRGLLLVTRPFVYAKKVKLVKEEQKRLGENEQNKEKIRIYYPETSFKGNGNIYVFSELNHKSIALAQDIKSKQCFSTFVFYDVYEAKKEEDFELIDEARKIGAILFKKDVSAFKAKRWKIKSACRIEFFLIGENEAENVNQAIRLNERYKDRYNTQIFVWAHSPESITVLDSVNTIDENAKSKRKNDVDNPFGYKLRRVDDIEIFVWNALKDAKLFRDGKKEKISLLIVGMGEYGMEILKTATWMYQMEGVELEINAVDVSDKTKKRLLSQCPEILQYNDNTTDGDAHYSIRILDSIDIFEDDCGLSDENSQAEEAQTDGAEKLIEALSGLGVEGLTAKRKVSFRNLLLGDNPADPEMAERLRRTTDVFVALGDDDTNIRAAMEIRRIFDQVNFRKGFEKVKDDYSEAINEDFEKIKTFASDWNYTYRVSCYKDIHKKVFKKVLLRPFAEEDGSLRYTGAEGTTERMRGLGKINSTYILNGFRAKRLMKDFSKEAVALCKKSEPRIFTQVYDSVKAKNISGELKTYEEIPYEIIVNGSFDSQYRYDVITRKEEEAKAIPYHLRWSNDDESKRKYNRFEYFRHSSMAQALHKEMVTEIFSKELACRKKESDEASDKTKKTSKKKAAKIIKRTTKSVIDELNAESKCNCEGCRKSKKVEHMRWNAYMRANGYKQPPQSEVAYGIKSSRAKYHYELVPYDALSPEEQAKDSTISKKP